MCKERRGKNAIQELRKVDLVVAAAGIIQSTAKHGDDQLGYMNECIDVNVKSTMNTIMPFVPQMQVLLCSIVVL